MMPSYQSLKRDLAFAMLALGVVATTSVLGQIATYPNLSPWYAGLVKPSFNPPNWVFAPVWTILYALMAFALWRILRMPSSRRRHYAIGLFFLLLVLNAAWSWMFFWARSPLLGLINIVPQLVVILATIVGFARVDRLSALCLLPLAAWVAYATGLNAAIWLLNS
jgi:tryptophan-rich sensory protein